MAQDRRHLKLRGHTWYAQLAVPKHAQEAVGSKTLTRSLGTRDIGVARKRRHAVIAEFQSLIAQAAARQASGSSRSAESLLDSATDLRDAIERGEAEPKRAWVDHDAAVERHLEARARELGVDAEGIPKLPEGELGLVRRSYSVLSGRAARSLERQLSTYLGEQGEHLRPQTVSERQRWIGAFVDWFGGERGCDEVERDAAGTYVREVIQARTVRGQANGRKVSGKTRKKEVGAVGGFFEWLVARGLIDDNPFDRVASTIRTSTRGRAPVERAYTLGELEVLLRGLEREVDLWAFAALGAYTGMRREEVTTLRVDSVDGAFLRVIEGKTRSAVRRVPIHPSIVPLIEKLRKGSSDGYLLPELISGGQDNRRGFNIGKRFNRRRPTLGLGKPGLSYHSLRRNFITGLESAGVAESTIQLLVGHKRRGITLGVYSGGVPDERLREALEMLSYGTELDEYVRHHGSALGSAIPKRRKNRGGRKRAE